MKTQKYKFRQIFKLYLLKSKAYEQTIKKNNLNFSVDIDLTRIIINFKKILQVIFNFHKLEKRILFVGMPKKLELQINKLTNHVAVPDDFELQGIISKNFKNKKSKNVDIVYKSLLPKLSKKPDLVVLFSSKKTNSIMLESYFGKVPLISFGIDSDFKNVWLNNSYNVCLNNTSLKSVSNKNLLFIGLNFLFKTVKKKNVRKRTFNKFTPKFNSKFSGQRKRFK